MLSLKCNSNLITACLRFVFNFVDDDLHYNLLAPYYERLVLLKMEINENFLILLIFLVYDLVGSWLLLGSKRKR